MGQLIDLKLQREHHSLQTKFFFRIIMKVTALFLASMAFLVLFGDEGHSQKSCRAADGPWKNVPGQDSWCNDNCNHVPPYCPSSHCTCSKGHAQPGPKPLHPKPSVHVHVGVHPNDK